MVFPCISTQKVDKELLEILSTADICVNPDRPGKMNDMSTMIKIMEYMALSKPIVQFDLREGRRSAVGASLYATPNDELEFSTKILELVDDPVTQKAMGKVGRARMENLLEWRHQAPKLLTAYASLKKDATESQSVVCQSSK